MKKEKNLLSILQVVDSLNAGGAERVAVDLGNELSRLGHRSFLCATRKTGSLKSDLLDSVTFFKLGRQSTFDIDGIRVFRNFVKENQIDVVHAHGNSSAMFCIVALLGSGARIVHHDHNPLLEKRKLWMERLILKQVDCWICVSDPILHWAKEKVNYSKAVLINNPVDENRFFKNSITGKLKQGIRNIVMIANYKEHKDYFNLLRAIQQIENEFPEYRFQCYGGNTESNYYKKLVSYKESENLKNVELLPSSNNIPKVLSNAVVGVLSSESEGLPISLLEYMAEGLPVVVTDVGDCGRIVRDAKNGLVVPPQTPESLAKALGYLLTNQSEWEMMSRNGSEFIAQYFSLQSFAGQVVKLYRSIVLV